MGPGGPLLLLWFFCSCSSSRGPDGPDGPDGKVIALKKVNLVLIGVGPDQAVAEAGDGGVAKRAGGDKGEEKDGEKGGKKTGPGEGPTAEATPLPSARPANDEKAAPVSGTSAAGFGTSGSSRAAASAASAASATPTAPTTPLSAVSVGAGGDPKKTRGRLTSWAGTDRPPSRRMIRGSKKGSTPWGGWGTLKPSPRVAEELARGPGCVHRCLDKFLAAHMRTNEINARRKCGLCMTTSKFALTWDLSILTLSIFVVFIVVLRTYLNEDVGLMIT